jgi:hypothetical protein
MIMVLTGTEISKLPNLSEEVVAPEFVTLISAASTGTLLLEMIFPLTKTSCARSPKLTMLREIMAKVFRGIRGELIVNLIIENDCLASILEVS